MDLSVARLASDHPDLVVTWWTAKEELGQLRVRFGLSGAPAEAWPTIREPVDRAEEASVRT